MLFFCFKLNCILCPVLLFYFILYGVLSSILLYWVPFCTVWFCTFIVCWFLFYCFKFNSILSYSAELCGVLFFCSVLNWIYSILFFCGELSSILFCCVLFCYCMLYFILLLYYIVFGSVELCSVQFFYYVVICILLYSYGKSLGIGVTLKMNYEA